MANKGTNTRKPHAALKPMPMQMLSSVSIFIFVCKSPSTGHCAFQFDSLGAGLQVQKGIQSVEFEKIPMRFAWGRTRSAIAQMFETVKPLLGPFRRVLAFRQILGKR